MKIQKALFIKTKNIGDSIILTASISALPKTFKYVDVICLPESQSIFEMNNRVRNVFVIPRHLSGFYKLRAYFNIYKKLFSEHYDLLAQFSFDWRGAFLARFINVDLSVARRNAHRGFFWEKSFDYIASPLDLKRSIADQDVDLLRLINLYEKKIAPAYSLNVKSSQKNKILRWFEKKHLDFKSNWIVIHASSRWKFKEIPKTTWVRVIDALALKNISVVLSGSQSDLQDNEDIISLCKSKPILVKDFSLKDTAALYQLANLVVTIDSMSTHLSSAVGTPVISIFGPTSDKNWGPWMVKHKIIALGELDDPSFSCRPCYKEGCEGSRVSDCLNQVNYKSIIDNICDLLNKK